MRITNRDAIKNGEQELIDAISADLEWEVIEKVFRSEHRLEIDDRVEYKKGDIVVHNGQVAYQMAFDVKVSLSVLVDREGNYISVSSSGETSEGDTDLETKTSGNDDEEQKSPYEETVSALKVKDASDPEASSQSSAELKGGDDVMLALGARAGRVADRMDGGV